MHKAEGVRIVGKTVDENSFWGTAILLYIEEVELQFHIYNVDTFDTITDSAPITFSAQ